MNSSERHRLYWLFERIPQAATVVAVAVGESLQKILMAMGLFLKLPIQLLKNGAYNAPIV